MSEDKEYQIKDTTCHNCYKTFSGKSQLYRHLREVHHEYERLNSFYGINECTYKCLEGCDVSFRFNRDLRNHLNGSHSFNILETSKKFLNIEAFHRWLIQKQETGTKYVKHNGQKGSKVTYYSCNRSGLSRIKTTNRKRRHKKNGPRKINAGCTSYLKLKENGNCCTVTYCDFHYGHEIELEHIPLPFESRSAILEKLTNGAQLVKINLQKGDFEFENIQRSDLLTRSDLKNLKSFSKSKRARLTLPTLTEENSNGLKKIDPSCISRCEKIDIFSNSNDEINNMDKLNQQTSIKDGVTDYKSPVTKKQIEVDKNVIGEETIQVLEKGDGDRSVIIDYSAEVSYVDDDIQEISDTEEDVFGYHVAEILKRIEPMSRESAKVQINEILESFLLK